MEYLDPYLNQSQRNTIFKNNELTDAGIKDLESVVQQFLFDGGDVALPELYENLSHTQKEGLRKALPYIFSTSAEKSITPEIQEAILALNDFGASKAGSFEGWLSQSDMFNNGMTPREKYSPTAIKIAEILETSKSQKEISSQFGKYAENVNDRPATMFEEAVKGGSKKEGIKEVFKTEYDESKKPEVSPRSTEEALAKEEPKPEPISEKPSRVEPKPAEPIKPAEPAERELPAEQPKKPRAKKEPGKFEQEATKIADKIKATELPKWLQTLDKDITKRGGGLSPEQLRDMLADAVVTMGKLMDKGVEFSQAVKVAVKQLIKAQGEENRDAIEKGFSEYYRENAGEPPKPPVSEKRTSPEFNEDMTKMANAINDAYVEGKFGIKALDDVLAKLQETDVKEIYEKVKEDILGGKINVKETRERITTTKKGSERDQAVLLYDLADLKGKEDQIQKAIIESTDEAEKLKLQKDLIDVQNQMMDNALANRMLGRTASTIFRIRQAWVNRDADLAQMEQQYKASKGIKNLTKEQEKIVKSAYDKIRELKAKANKAKQELSEAIEKQEKLSRENEVLQKLKNDAKQLKKKERTTKTSEKIEASRKRIEEARERLRKIRGNMNDVTRVVPETAYEISKIAAEKIYQGVLKFDQLVKEVYEDVKDIFPEWTEKDVRQHLLPEIDVESFYEGKEDIPKSAEDIKAKLNTYQKLQGEYAKKLFEWQKDRAADVMQQMPAKTRIIDKILRWQRFAVLSYPSTMVKLGAVVAHQLAFKPLKFAAQYLQSKALGKTKLGKEQQIFGSPSIKALAKYYSEFIRNFSAANLKEQFSGIDTKEILYGKKFMYDEWAAGKGLLEIPGRSHGYIKSFIKNPEFEFAHEQLVSWHMNKMDEISKELENPNLTSEKRTELEEEYKNNDVTNEQVLEKINSQSLNHAKWAIMMNDNKFVDSFRKFADKNEIAGALIRSELPIVKIPVNFVSRVFAYKYGTIQAIIGKVGDKGKFPGAIEIIKKGSKDLTNEQAEFIGKSLTLGTIGLSFFALGYYNRDKIKENEDGSYEINGVHVSKNLIHSPEIETLLNGANMGNRMKGDQGFLLSMLNSEWDIIKKSPFVSMLTFGFLPNVATALMSKQGEDKKADAISYATSKKITDMTVPGFVKQLAQWTDVEGGGIQPMGEPAKRKPQGTNLEKAIQTFEMAVPGLRQNVPISEIQPTSSQISKLKEYGVEPPRFGTRSQYKIEVDRNHKKEGTTKDGKDYSYMTEPEFIKFNSYKKEYLNKALDIVYESKPNKEELNKLLEKINRQATLIAKQKLISEGLISEPEEKEEEEETDISESLKELYESEKPE
jgi:hypothetical protein